MNGCREGWMDEEERNMEKTGIEGVLLVVGRQTELFGELERQVC